MFLARHDDLTGLPNRLAFGEQLEQVAEKAARGSRFALLTVDLDRFKELNDTLGHPVGDDVLKQAAARLLATVRDGDFVTRLGGDEFAIIQTRIDQPDDAAVLAQRVIEALSEPFALDGHTAAIGASVGVALAPQDSSAADDLLMKSDLALYRAKGESRGTFRFFEPRMDARLKERRELEADLRKAIKAGEFELHYQPIIDLASGAVSTLEALLRWRHPERGLVMPNDIIPAAEESGLIIPIGEWVLRQACRDAATWPQDVRVAVNLSAAQFKRGDLVAIVDSYLGESRLPAERFELEITESVLLHDEAWALSVLQELRTKGVRIAMDDFGTGYSSLSYLRAFPFNKIKIDRGFVADLCTTASGRAIVEATIQLSRKLGLVTTAEGVETAEQMRILIDEGCAEAQGFHFSAAMPASEIQRFLAKSQPKAA
ncbi:MAG: putative bifunctional diguanylate cyclase/phosphodiesterase [Sphingosinicella sp.]